MPELLRRTKDNGHLKISHYAHKACVVKSKDDPGYIARCGHSTPTYQEVCSHCSYLEVICVFCGES